jgi:hypothetical protein
MTKRKERKRKLAAVDAKLREMVKAIEDQPVPSRLLSVLDQLDDEDVVELEAKAHRRG